MVRLTEGGAGTRRLFFCANSLAEVQPLAELLRGEMEIWLLESGYGHVPTTTPAIRDIAERHAREILEIAGDEPIHLMGYSFACLVATEIAEQLRNRGAAVAFLGWLDNRNAPAGLFSLYRRIEQRWEHLLNRWREEMSDGKGFRAGRLGRVIVGVAGRRLNLRRQARSSPAAAAFTMQAEPYRTPPSTVPVHLFVAREHRLRNWLFPSLGWNRTGHPNLHLWQTEGTHYTVCLPGHALTLARLLRRALAVADSSRL